MNKPVRRSQYWVYMMRCNDGSLYTGYTKNLENRVALHKSGKGARYVRNKLPAELVYTKEYQIYKCAINEERRIKTLTAVQKRELVKGYIKKMKKKSIQTSGPVEKYMKKALLVIDVQNVYFSKGLKVTHPAKSFDNILKVIDKAAKKNIPVIIIQHSANTPLSKGFQKGSRGWMLHPKIEQRPRNVLIEKTFPGSFTGTNLESWLRENKIDTVAICGYMTQMCCDTTARQAYHRGFSVEFLSDATGTLAFSNPAGSVTAEELHRATLVTQATRFSKVMTSKDWINSL